MFVVNDAVSSCCGSPTAKCTCDEKKKKKEGTPTPIPVFNWASHFRDQLAPKGKPKQEPVINSRGTGKPTPLGIPTFSFENPATRAKQTA